jgi:hypothetical protein
LPLEIQLSRGEGVIYILPLEIQLSRSIYIYYFF